MSLESYTRIIHTEAPHWCAVHVYHSEDWHDLLPRFSDAVTGSLVNLTTLEGLEFDFWARPSAAHETLITRRFYPGGGIVLDGVAAISIHANRDDVDEWPVGTWEQWLSMRWIDDRYGQVFRLIWHGPFYVHAGRFTQPVVAATSIGAGGGDLLGAGGGDTIGAD